MSSRATPRLDYEQAIAYISSTGRFGIKLGLERTRALLDALGAPDRGMRGVLVAGTNGKGSTCAVIASVLRQTGRHVGMMPKPHLQSYTERICVDGTPISEREFASLVESLEPAIISVAAELGQPTEFEILTAAAIQHMRARGIDLLVCEVGLGGRLDSTNVLDLGVKVITNVALDHEAHLGPDISSIAREKAGIIGGGDVVVTGELLPEAAAAVDTRFREVAARSLWRLGVDVSYRGRSGWAGVEVDASGPGFHVSRARAPLLGRHQVHNVALALATLQAMSSTHGITFTPAQVDEGLEAVRWPGRLEPVPGNDRKKVGLLIDSAHNPDAVREVVASVRELLADTGLSRVVVLFGAMSDKNWAAMIELLPRDWPAVHTAVAEARAADPERLLVEARRQGRTQDTAMSPPHEALRLARERAGRDGLVLVLGSLYLAGAVRQALRLT